MFNFKVPYICEDYTDFYKIVDEIIEQIGKDKLVYSKPIKIPIFIYGIETLDQLPDKYILRYCYGSEVNYCTLCNISNNTKCKYLKVKDMKL